MNESKAKKKIQKGAVVGWSNNRINNDNKDMNEIVIEEKNPLKKWKKKCNWKGSKKKENVVILY